MDTARGSRDSWLFVLLAMFAPGWGLAQVPVVPEPAPDVRRLPVPAADELAITTSPEEVLPRMHRIHQLHLELAQVGSDRGSTRTVRNYARRLVRDHRMAARRVRDVADDLGIPVSEALPPDMRAHADELLRDLRQLEGADFDRMFVDTMMRHHDAAIDAFTSSLLRVRVYPVERLLARVTPIVRQHYDLGRILGEELRA